MISKIISILFIATFLFFYSCSGELPEYKDPAASNNAANGEGESDTIVNIPDGGESDTVVNIPDGLVAYYPFNGNARDESGNGFDGTVNGATLTTDRFGKADSAYQINGLNYISLDFRIFNGLADFTVATWVSFANFNQNGPSATNQILSVANGSSDAELALNYWTNHSYFSMSAKQKSIGGFAQNTIVEDGKWHFIVVSRSGSAAKLYIDGQQIEGSKTISSGRLVVSKNGVVLGQDQDTVGGDFAENQNLFGKLDEFRVYNRDLPASEIQKLYGESDTIVNIPDGGKSDTVVNIPDGLVAYYPFNGNARDESGNFNDGTVNGATLTTDRFGNANSAYSFDGVDDKIVVNDDLDNLAPATLTISAWGKRNGESGTYDLAGMILYKGNYDPLPNMAYAIQVENNTHIISLRSDTASKDYTNILSNNPMDLTNWYHFVGVFDNNLKQMRFYINGELMGENSFAGTIKQKSEPLCIGAYCYNDGYHFNGIIDDIRLYNRALSASEIQKLYNEGNDSLFAIASPDQKNMLTNSKVTLDGSGSSNDVIYTWSITSSPEGSTSLGSNLDF